jgi:hypothetical protein
MNKNGISKSLRNMKFFPRMDLLSCEKNLKNPLSFFVDNRMAYMLIRLDEFD